MILRYNINLIASDDKNIFGELPPGGEGLLAKGEKASFTWKRDGQPFDPEERFKVFKHTTTVS